MDVLRVLAWADYAIPSVNSLFEERTGIPVDCELFDQNEDAHARVSRAPRRYDVVFADGHWPRRYLEDRLVQPLPTSRFRSWEQVDPGIAEWCSTQLWPAGPGVIAAYPANWGVRGIVWDPEKVESVESWQALWSAPDGTIWLNSQGSEVIAEAALAVGCPPAEIYELSGERLEVVEQALVELAPRIGGVWSLLPELEDAFVRHGAWMAEVHTTALVANLEWAVGRRLEVTVPAEGSVGYLDGAMVTAATGHPDLAIEFVDLLFSTLGVERQWAESDGYPPANAEARKLLGRHPRFREKLRRADLHLGALRQCQLYRPPRDIEAYLDCWRATLRHVSSPVPPEVLRAVGL